MSDDLIVRAKRTAVGLRTWDHPNEANLMEDLADEVERLRATVEQVQELADTYGYTPNMTSVHHEIADQIARAIDGAPDRRRVETAEDLDALPDRTVIRDADEWVFEKLNYSNDGTGESFWAAPAIDPDTSEWDIEPELPAIVLWMPEVSS